MSETDKLTNHGYIDGLISNARRRYNAEHLSWRELGHQAFEELVQIADGNVDIELTDEQLAAVQEAVKNED